MPKDILKTEVINATAKLGISEKNVVIYNYQVRKLNYSRLPHRDGGRNKRELRLGGCVQSVKYNNSGDVLTSVGRKSVWHFLIIGQL